MMVFDSGAIFTAISTSKSQKLFGQCTSSLAGFELGNIVWKNVVLAKTITSSDAYQLLDACDLVLSKMQIVSPITEDVFRLAHQHHISFYDAAYVALAVKYKSPLITLDMKLAHKLGKRVNIISFDEFARHGIN